MKPFSIAPVISTLVQTVQGAMFGQGKINGKGEWNIKKFLKTYITIVSLEIEARRINKLLWFRVIFSFLVVPISYIIRKSRKYYILRGNNNEKHMKWGFG